MKKRLHYLDVVKFISVMWIFLVHYINSFRPSLFLYWNTYPGYWLLNGLSGKFAVSMLAVVLGYLAYQKGKNTESLAVTTFKRYISFFMIALFSNIIYAWYYGYDFRAFETIRRILAASVKLNDSIFPTFWCIKSFFLGSVISYISGKYNLSEIPIILIILVSALAGNTWIAICLMGNLLFRITSEEQKTEKVQHGLKCWWMQFAMLVFVFFAIKQPESEKAFFIDGICSLLILLIISFNERIRKIFQNRPLAFLGKYSMGIFLLHPVVYSLIGGEMLSPESHSIVSFWTVFLLCAGITMLLAIILVKLINFCTSMVMKTMLSIIRFLKHNSIRSL